MAIFFSSISKFQFGIFEININQFSKLSSSKSFRKGNELYRSSFWLWITALVRKRYNSFINSKEPTLTFLPLLCKHYVTHMLIKIKGTWLFFFVFHWLFNLSFYLSKITFGFEQCHLWISLKKHLICFSCQSSLVLLDHVFLII